MGICGARCAAGGSDLGESEIENFGVAAAGDENIRGLDVAMHDAFGVRGVESVGDFNGEIEKFVEFEGAAGDAVLESFAVEVLHGDEGLLTRSVWPVFAVGLRRCRKWCRCWGD